MIVQLSWNTGPLYDQKQVYEQDEVIPFCHVGMNGWVVPANIKCIRFHYPRNLIGKKIRRNISTLINRADLSKSFPLDWRHQGCAYGSHILIHQILEG
jgi:hypothetical protein